MVKTVFADENIQNVLYAVSVKEGFTPGFIIGQPSEKKDVAIHAVVITRLQDDFSSTQCCVNEFGQIEENWLKVHLKNVSRSLSGGMYVLGLFIVGPKDIFADKLNLQKVRSLINTIHSISKSNIYIFGSNQPKNLIVLYFSSQSKKFLCKSFDVLNMSMSMSPANWKFIKQPTSWYRIDCQYNLVTLLPYFSEKKIFLKMCKFQILEYFKKNIDDCKFFINSITNKRNTSLEEIRDIKIIRSGLQEKKQKRLDTEGHKYFNIFKAMIYKWGTNENDVNLLEIGNAQGKINFDGFISSKVFLHKSATLEEAITAVKEDLLRSFAARLDIHCDSLQEDSSTNESMTHFLPRRVVVKHEASGILFTDYMFPDDTKEDIVNSVKEQLGIDVTPELVIALESDHQAKLKESWSDCLNKQRKETQKADLVPSNKPSAFLIYSLFGASIVMIISIAIHFLV
ncbi:protein odr-4 homolog isoform X1 [Rhodnius prolixus]